MKSKNSSAVRALPPAPVPLHSPGGARLIHFPFVSDPRGNLMVGEFPKHLPFQPARFFVTYDVPVGSIRGEHAHRNNEQIIVCLKGSLTVTLDDGTLRTSYELNSPDVGVFIPRLIWGMQSGHSADCVMLVLASEAYDERSYIRNYDEFQACVRGARIAPEAD